MIRKFAPDVKILEVQQIRKLLGRGAFGQVVELRCKGHDPSLAGKILKDEDLGASEEQADRAVKRTELSRGFAGSINAFLPSNPTEILYSIKVSVLL